MVVRQSCVPWRTRLDVSSNKVRHLSLSWIAVRKSCLAWPLHSFLIARHFFWRQRPPTSPQRQFNAVSLLTEWVIRIPQGSVPIFGLACIPGTERPRGCGRLVSCVRSHLMTSRCICGRQGHLPHVVALSLLLSPCHRSCCRTYPSLYWERLFFLIFNWWHAEEKGVERRGK